MYQTNYFTQLAVRNICRDVTTKDISDLFQMYPYKKFAFECDSQGKFIGSVVLHCTNDIAEKIKHDFGGACIDGRLLIFESLRNAQGIHPKLVKAVQTIIKETAIGTNKFKFGRKRKNSSPNKRSTKNGEPKKSGYIPKIKENGIGKRGAGKGFASKVKNNGVTKRFQKRRERKPVISKEQLDKELEDYFKGGK